MLSQQCSKLASFHVTMVQHKLYVQIFMRIIFFKRGLPFKIFMVCKCSTYKDGLLFNSENAD